MGNRYVEVMFVNKEQYDEEMTRQPGSVSDPPLCLCVCAVFISGGAFDPLGIDFFFSPTLLPLYVRPLLSKPLKKPCTVCVLVVM